MADRLAIFRCPCCTGSLREYDLPALTEHIAKIHLDGFYVFHCPGCQEKFATSYRACHHMMTCDAEALAPESSKPLHDLDFSKHMELQKIVNRSIKNKMDELGNKDQSVPGTTRKMADSAVNTDICMPDDLMQTFISEPYSPPLQIVLEEEEENDENGNQMTSSPSHLSSNTLLDAWSPESPPRSEPAISSSTMGIPDIESRPVSPEPLQIKQEDLEEPMQIVHGEDEYLEPVVEVEQKRPRKRRFDVADPEHPELGTLGFAEHPAVGSPRLISVGVPSKPRVGLLGDAPKNLLLPPPQSPAEPQSASMFPGVVKDVDLMSLPQFGNASSTSYQANMGYGQPINHYPSHNHLPIPPRDRSYGSKLVGGMSLRNMCMFDQRTPSTDVIVEIEGTRGSHVMYFESKFLQEHSEYFNKIFSTIEFKEQAEKRLSIHTSLSSFIDCMHILYEKPLPWKMRCRGYFCIPNIHRVYRMMNCAHQFNFNVVADFVSRELFAAKCGPDCVGCIDRVAIALHFGITVPEDVVFTPLAAFTWLNDCETFSCAPEIQATAAVSAYLKTFINAMI